MPKRYDLRRMCRLNGEQPTMRDRWQAFYQLWRACGGRDPANNTCDALRVLLPCHRWLKLANGGDDEYESLRFMPIPVRRMRLKIRKERRQRELELKLLHAIMTEPTTNEEEADAEDQTIVREGACQA